MSNFISWVHRFLIFEIAFRYRMKHDEDGEHAEVLKLIEATVDVVQVESPVTSSPTAPGDVEDSNTLFSENETLEAADITMEME